jgi:ribosomal protein S18 acetylase RimI-like enzyme
VTIRRATVADINVVAPLFDAYRQFYRQRSDPEAARRFLQERLEREESIVFLALDGETAIGFMQLYPSFSSVSMARIFVLNDLFVSPEARRAGAASALLRAAADYGRGAGAVRLTLSTELTNTTAQSVYEKNGWQRDTVFCAYQLVLAEANRPIP